ncbi:vomeronasal type-1 receptor 90-like [Cynocephalus volans]|uniref:vomeronasal type-1 receptor 90-like n=1 Tax=Cynocephalus volans TaxID=110931 RepID=UPI002FCC2001
MVLVCTIGIPEKAAALGLRTLMDDVVCKTNSYLHRVSHGLSICLTSLLSILQAIIISPNSSYWAAFKTRSPLYILYSFFFVWILNLLISSKLIISVIVLKNGTLSRDIVKSCFILPMDDLSNWFFLMFMALRDVSFLGVMCWTSGYMLRRLYRHHKQTQHLHKPSTPFKRSPEMKATKKIIVLTLCFVSFYGLDTIVSFTIVYFSTNDPGFLNAKKFIGVSFALLSPVVLLSNDNQLHRFWASVFEKIMTKKDEAQ